MAKNSTPRTVPSAMAAKAQAVSAFLWRYLLFLNKRPMNILFELSCLVALAALCLLFLTYLMPRQKQSQALFGNGAIQNHPYGMKPLLRAMQRMAKLFLIHIAQAAIVKVLQEAKGQASCFPELKMLSLPLRP